MEKLNSFPWLALALFSRNTAKYFDHVVYAEVKNKKHNFYSSTTSASNLNTGSRTGISLESITDSPLITLFRDPPASAPTQKQVATSSLTSLLGKK